MKNKLLLFTLIGFLIFLTGFSITFFSPALAELAYVLMAAGNIISKFFGLLMLSSKIRKTIYFKLILLCMGIVILGEVFFILHWAGYFLLLSAGALGVITTYTIRFYYKEEKKRLDALKLCWVLTTYIGVLLIVLNFLPKEAGFICELFFWAMILDYIVSARRKEMVVESSH